MKTNSRLKFFTVLRNLLSLKKISSEDIKTEDATGVSYTKIPVEELDSIQYILEKMGFTLDSKMLDSYHYSKDGFGLVHLSVDKGITIRLIKGIEERTSHKKEYLEFNSECDRLKIADHPTKGKFVGFKYLKVKSDINKCLEILVNLGYNKVKSNIYERDKIFVVIDVARLTITFNTRLD